MADNALRSFVAEPRVPDPPGRAWWDWALVAAILAGGVVEVAVTDAVSLKPLVLVLVVAPAVGLLWRRTHPLQVWLAVVGGALAADVVIRVDGGEPLELFTSVYALLVPYALLRWGSGRDAVIGLGIALVMLIEAVLTTGAEALAGVPFLLLPAALGATVRYRMATRLRQTEEVKLRERAQLARELHDTVAHHVSAIAIQAQAGQAVAATRPTAAVETLAVIEEAASRTLSELRSIVRALRDGAEPELAPQRGIADIEQLAAAGGEGPRIEVELEGELAGVGPVVSAALYRIAQESITNAVRHAHGATRVRVRVAADRERVRLVVSDDGADAGAGAGQGGYGLVGMSERAALLGGVLAAGPAPGHGWTVTAVLPRGERGT